MIDCHCHILPEEITQDVTRYGSLDPHFGLLTRTKNARFKTGKDLLVDMAKHSLDQAVVFGFGFKDIGISRAINDYVASVCKEHPDKFVGLAVLDPEREGALKEAERALDIGLKGFGELFPAGHGFDLCGPAMKNLAGLAGDAGVPLLVHVNEQIGHMYPGKGSTGPKEAYWFARENPDVTIVFAHLGGGLPFFYYMPEIKRLRNVYYDTAAQPFLYSSEVYQGLKLSGALEQIVLGSDYPLLKWTRYSKELSHSGLIDDDIDRVISKNPEKVFGKFFLRRKEGD